MFRDKCEEYERLLDLSLTGQVPVEKIMRETALLTQELKEALKTATSSEKEEILAQFKAVQAKLATTTKNAERITGLSEQELLHYANDPTRFSKKQWEEVQASKQEMDENRKEISSLMGGRTPAVNPTLPSVKKRTTWARRKHWIKT